MESCKNKIKRLEDRIAKKSVAKKIKDDNKTIALSTSKLNYLDPRISVAWCKKHNVPIDKVGCLLSRVSFLADSLCRMAGVQPDAAQEVHVGD